jgi:hypothetical protein
MRGYDRTRRYDNNAASRRQANRRRRRKDRAWLYSVQFLPLPHFDWLTWPW